jgi:hypothetical protein
LIKKQKTAFAALVDNYFNILIILPYPKKVKFYMIFWQSKRATVIACTKCQKVQLLMAIKLTEMSQFFKNLPVFVPKAQDSHITELGLKLPTVMMDTRHVVWRPSVATKIRKVAKILIIDPATDMLMFKDASEGVNFKKLGYPEKVEPTKIYSDESFRREQIVKTAIEDQKMKGADVIIAPYFYAEDTEDVKFNLNLTMLGETVQYMEQKKLNLPLLAYIEIGKPILNRRTVINSIVDRYRDFGDKLSGLFITINDGDCKKLNEEELLSFANLVQQLSETLPIFVMNIGPFGEILCALGASGFGSGLTTGENFSVKHLQDSPEGWSPPVEKTYIPELFDYLNDEAVKKIGYKCQCKICSGSFPQDPASKKKHFILAKMDFMDSLRVIPIEKRAGYIEVKLSEAIKASKQISTKHGVDLKNTYLQRWLNTVKSAGIWNPKEDEKELEAILTDLESK